MVHALSLKARARSRACAWSLWLFSCLGLALPSARADVLLAPAPDGHVGAFLVLVPLSGSMAADAEQLPEPRLGPARGSSVRGVWQLLANGHGALDLAKHLHTGRAGSRALIGGALVLDQDFDGYLLLSVDGGVSVHVDGQRIWSASGRHYRGNGWDTVPLKLAAGSHPVVLAVEHPGVHWALEMRWLERKSLRPPRNARWKLEGVPDSANPRLRSELLQTHLSVALSPRGFAPSVTIAYPRGVPTPGPRQAHVRTRFAGRDREFALGSVPVNAHGAQKLVARLPTLEADDLAPGVRRQRFDIEVGGKVESDHIVVSRRALELLDEASTVRASLLEDGSLDEDARDVALQSIAFEIEALQSASASGYGYRMNLAQTHLAELLDHLKHDPIFFLHPGVHQLAHTSPIDGRPQTFWVHVPLGYDPTSDQSYPAVLALHGYNGSPKGITQAFLDSKSDKARPSVNGFVIAPEAHGNAFYRGPGEYEAMDVLALARRLYHIDASRIGITGVSMGGTGAAQLALRYSDKFSSAAPLCGYHSYFIRHDTSGREIRPWEEARMHHWSTSSWAANGRHLPLFVAQGTRDHPLENSRSLIRAYQEQGFSVEQEWPDIGHQVWTISYRGARLWTWLSRHVRPSSPDHVTLVTDALRYGKKYWVEIDQFETFGKRAKLDAERQSPTSFVVRTENVQRFTLRPEAQTSASSPLSVSVDGESLEFAEPPLELYRTDRWHAGRPTLPEIEKRPGVEGPIRDVLLGPVAFVYGSLSPSTSRTNREVARHFARYHHGATLRYPVFADREVTPELEASHSLVLVGTPVDHALLRRWNARLPISTIPGGIRFGASVFLGDDVGAIFVYPNPEHPDHSLVVITAPEIAGILQALFLPRLLPDFVVYDRTLRDASTEQVLGSAQVLAAGFFGNDWGLPEQ